MISMRSFMTGVLLCWTILVVAHVSAQDFASVGLELVTTNSEGSEVESEVRDAEGNALNLVYEDTLSEEELELVVRFSSLFFSWKHLIIENLTYVFFADEVEMSIFPSEFEYRQHRFTEYIRSGISFYHSEDTEYAFRLRVGKHYPLVSGVLTTEEAFCEAILAVINAYSVKPPADAEQPEIITTPNDSASEVSDDAIEDEKLDAIGESIKEHQSQLISLEDGMQQLTDEVDSLRNSQEQAMQVVDELKTRVDSLEKENEDLRRGFELLRTAVMVLHNTGIFGNINLIQRDGIKRIIELKEDDPSLSQEDVAQTLRREGISMSAHEVYLVFSVYYNDFK